MKRQRISKKYQGETPAEYQVQSERRQGDHSQEDQPVLSKEGVDLIYRGRE